MRITKRIFAVALSALLMLSAGFTRVEAGDVSQSKLTPYTYTVRIFAGRLGFFREGGSVRIMRTNEDGSKSSCVLSFGDSNDIAGSGNSDETEGNEESDNLTGKTESSVGGNLFLTSEDSAGEGGTEPSAGGDGEAPSADEGENSGEPEDVDVQPTEVTILDGVELEFHEDVIIIKGLQYYDQITFVAANNVSLNEEKDSKTEDGEAEESDTEEADEIVSKYYVRGIRESGQDNDDVVNAAFRVEKDQDYVVAYGLKSGLVKYTVNYQDANGNALAESEEYYGNVGDMPVVAYLYFEYYQPQAYNLTKTLDSDESKNVFTFVYTYVENGVITNTTVIPGIFTDLGTVVIGGGGAGAGGGAGGGDAAVEPEGEEILDNPIPEGGLEEPDEVENLDDEQLPLGNFEGLGNLGEVLSDGVMLFAGIPMVARIGIAAALVSVLGAGAWFALLRRKKQKIENEDEDE